MKVCRKCNHEKEETEFYAQPNSKDGLASSCKECTKAGVRANRAAKIEYYRDYEKSRSCAVHRVAARKAYAETEKGRQAHARCSKKYIERYPLRRAAHIIVGNYIRAGNLLRKPCEICGAESDVHAHHDDYTKPLDVRWLCNDHHKEWHRNNKPNYGDQHA